MLYIGVPIIWPPKILLSLPMQHLITAPHGLRLMCVVVKMEYFITCTILRSTAQQMVKVLFLI